MSIELIFFKLRIIFRLGKDRGLAIYFFWFTFYMFSDVLRFGGSQHNIFLLDPAFYGNFQKVLRTSQFKTDFFYADYKKVLIIFFLNIFWPLAILGWYFFRSYTRTNEFNTFLISGIFQDFLENTYFILLIFFPISTSSIICFPFVSIFCHTMNIWKFLLVILVIIVINLIGYHNLVWFSSMFMTKNKFKVCKASYWIEIL